MSNIPYVRSICTARMKRCSSDPEQSWFLADVLIHLDRNKSGLPVTPKRREVPIDWSLSIQVKKDHPDWTCAEIAVHLGGRPSDSGRVSEALRGLR